jgi:ASCH domain.
MLYPDLPIKAISIMQPWAWLIVNGHKDIENRDWPTKYRGPVAIHAGKKMDDSALTSVVRGFHPVSGRRVEYDRSFRQGTETGGIVGVAEIVDCVDQSESEWFVGKHGFIIRNARPVPFIPVKGALSFFDWRKNL